MLKYIILGSFNSGGFPYNELISILLYSSGVLGLSIKYIIIFYLIHLGKTSLNGDCMSSYLIKLIFNLKGIGKHLKNSFPIQSHNNSKFFPIFNQNPIMCLLILNLMIPSLKITITFHLGTSKEICLLHEMSLYKNSLDNSFTYPRDLTIETIKSPLPYKNISSEESVIFNYTWLNSYR